MALEHVFLAMTIFAFFAIIFLYFLGKWARKDLVLSEWGQRIVMMLFLYLFVYIAIIFVYVLYNFFFWLLEL